MNLLKKLLFIIMLCLMAACAPSRKNPYLKKKKKSHVTVTQLGRNKYFYSTGYQKRLKGNKRKEP